MRITENNFIVALRRREERALGFVAEQYGGLMYAIIRKQLAALPDLQEECINDVLLAIWQNIDRYDETRSSFHSWLAAVCRYKAIDCRRRWLTRVQEQPIEDAAWMEDARSQAELLEQELFEETERILSCLRDEDRSLFRELFLEGVPVEEVAQTHGISRSNVYNRVSRGRKQIRRLYSEKGRNLRHEKHI